MKQFRIVSVFICALIASSTLFAMGGKKVSTGSRDIASERDVASEESESKNIPKMLSYEEFSALTPDNQELYLFGVRQVMSELASGRDKYSELLVDGRYQEYRNILDAILPQADAQWKNFDKPKQKLSLKSVRPRFERSIRGSEVWTCDATDAEFNYDVGTCVAKYGPLNGPAATCDKANYIQVNMARGRIRTLIGSPINHYCVPKMAWNQLSVKRRKELLNPSGAQSIAKVFTPDTSEIGADTVFGASQKVGSVAGALAYPEINEYRGSSSDPACNSSDSAVKFVADVGTCAKEAKGDSCEKGFKKVNIVAISGLLNKSVISKAYCVPAASYCLLPDSRRSVLDKSTEINSGVEIKDNRASAGERSAAVDQIKKMREEDVKRVAAQCAVEQGASVAKTSPAKQKKRALLSQPSERSVAAVASGDQCGSVKFAPDSCEDVKSREELRKANDEFYRKNVNKCIYAGNVSEFRNGKNEAKNCKPVTSISSLKLRCKEGVICNPILFGVKEDGQPFCATKNDGEATLECEGKASSEPAKASWLADNVENIKGEYNKLADGVNTMCGRNQARNYFCGECNIILGKLNSLNYFVKKNEGGQCVAKVQSYDSVVKPAEENKAKQ